MVAADAVQKDISEKFAAKGIDAAVTEAAVNQFIESFKMMSADKLEQYLQAPLQSLAELYADFEALENSSEYKQLSGKSQDEIESMLIEALLVRCVYEVNPDHKF